MTSKILSMLHEAVQIYDKRCGRDYLVGYSKGKESGLEYKELSFCQEYFWHLLGHKVIDKDKSEVYALCKSRKNILGKVRAEYSLKTIEQKYNALTAAFDFVENAKQIKIGFIENNPEAFQFIMALGNNGGIIGQYR